MAKTKPNANVKAADAAARKVLGPNTIINRVTKSGSVYRVVNPRKNQPEYLYGLDRNPKHSKSEWDRKISWLEKAGDQGKLVKTPGHKISRSGTVQANYRKEMQDKINKISDPKKRKEAQDQLDRSDADHAHELQLGGKDARSNMELLDAGVNSSSGAQIMNRNKHVPDGARVQVFRRRW